MSLETEYRRLCATPSDIYLHLPRMVALVEALDAKHVIELGTRTGVSTIAWLYALEKTGGRLTSVDLDTRPEIGEHDHWTFVQGDDCSDEVLVRLAELGQADIVFIDSSHLYDHTVEELKTYRYKVRPGGVICLHDTELATPEGAPARPLYPVRKALREFVERTGWEHVNFPDCWGFAIVKVPEETA
jgi:predicted O-methyltransferase YrrM